MFGTVVLGVARNSSVRRVVTGSALSRPVVRRFVPGELVGDAITAVQGLTADGLAVTLDVLGEDVTEQAQAEATVAAYRTLIDALVAAGLAQGNEISVKLSALGQSLGVDGPERATDRARELVAHAAVNGVDTTFDMEDHTTVDRTLETLREVRADFPRVGCVLQSMLRRTEADARDLATAGSRVRLVKGAYAEPPSVAHTARADVDRAFRRCAAILLEGQGYPMFGTHDPALITLIEDLLAARGDGDGAEFQMLYGIREPEQHRLVAAGHRVRTYVPFGTDWYGYFSRRLAERPANLLFFARSLISR